MPRARLLLLAGALALVLAGGLLAQADRGVGDDPSGARDGVVQVLASSITPVAHLAGQRPLLDTAGLVAVLAAVTLLTAVRGWVTPLAALPPARLRPVRSADRQPRGPPAPSA